MWLVVGVSARTDTSCSNFHQPLLKIVSFTQIQERLVELINSMFQIKVVN